MSITANSLISDSFNFFKNQLSGLFILSFISATISLILYYFLVPIDEMATIVKTLGGQNDSTSLLTWVSQLSDEEKSIMMRVSLLSLAAVFIGLILLVSSVVTYLSELSTGNSISAGQAFVLSLRILPNMLILLIICTIIIYFGFMLFILPGIILAIGFSLSPIILITVKNIMPLRAMSQSWKIALRHWWLILAILLLWLALQMLLTMLLGQFRFLPSMVNNIISFTLNNLLTSFTLIYFFRLYMLVGKTTN
ncbi:YciC family protein [Arsenophonus sp.]|uniref:YciC family protein n=1 Tax=Arsenophonus sp. TaxID=1872640 RepID=UPI00286281F7|nr:YciC family protein [Arsenophonus sp.]MDR5618014.1 YciC family protein [Arsenophonus sp.]